MEEQQNNILGDLQITVDEVIFAALSSTDAATTLATNEAMRMLGDLLHAYADGETIDPQVLLDLRQQVALPRESTARQRAQRVLTTARRPRRFGLFSRWYERRADGV